MGGFTPNAGAGDRFQDYVTAGLAAVCLVAGLGMQAILLWQRRPESEMPQWVIAMVSGFVLYFIGHRVGANRLNGNVTRLANAVDALVRRQELPPAS